MLKEKAINERHNHVNVSYELGIPGITQVLLTIYYKKIHQNVSSRYLWWSVSFLLSQVNKLWSWYTFNLHHKFSFRCINEKSKPTAFSMFAAKFALNESAMRTNNISIYNTVVKRFTGIEINGSLRSGEEHLVEGVPSWPSKIYRRDQWSSFG